MAVPRLLSRGRCLVPRTTPSTRVTPSAIPSIRTSISKRSFTASQFSWEEIVQTPSRGPEVALTDARPDARGPTTLAGSSTAVALLRMPKRKTRREIEQILHSKGCTIKKLQMRVDRFNFQNDTMCYVELGSEAEAATVIEELNGLEEQGTKMVVQPLKADFIWGDAAKRNIEPYGSRYFYDEGTAASEAIRPLLERRRTMLSVQTPGWSAGERVSVARRNALQIIERYFGKYGIEAVGDMSPFYGDKKKNPRMLCFIDFKTKEGAENAINDHHDTQIEDRLTWLKHSEPSGWRSHQIMKVAPEAFKELQESGVVPEDKQIYEDKFVNPLSKN